LVLILDQFPRNLYRGSRRSYEFDSKACEIALRSIEAGFDQRLHPLEASFLYLPLEHSEDLLLQERSVQLFQKLIPRAPVALRPTFERFTEFAIRHREVIRRFGRFPHRNAVLGRRSSREELAYLESGGETFGTADAEQAVVEFFFSPGSRYSYLAASQIPQLESDTGCRVHWRPVRGTDIRSFRGRDPFQGEPVSGQYEWPYRQHDAESWARYYGIPFREPPSRDLDFQLLARAAESANRMGAVAAYGWHLSSAVYGSDEWPLDLRLCVRIAEEVGLPTGDFTSLIRDPGTDRRLAATAREAHERGAFGVPTFFLGAEMFWGNDRIVLLRHALSESRTNS